MAGSVTDTDRGLEALVTRVVKASKGATVTVGIHSAEGGASDGGGKLTIAEVGTIQEFGDGRIPGRSFVRGWADDNQAQNEADLALLAKQVVDGKIDTATAMARFGLRAVGGIQNRIANGIAPANAQSTIDKKGSSTPLVDKGIMKSAIRHKVEIP